MCTLRPDRDWRDRPQQPHRDGTADRQSRQRRQPPGPATVEYYHKHAAAGLIVAEANPTTAPDGIEWTLNS